jgi:molybdate transport system ATP-binding protein
MPGDTLTVTIATAPAHAGGFHLDVAFEVPPGITVLFGPSGSGKSTTLAAIAGLGRPASGRIRLGEQTWFDRTAGVDLPACRRGVSLVFQSLALFPHLTAIENAAYGIDRAVPRAERRRRAGALLERMRVAHLADRKPASFSGGEAQRVALARAFARQPRLLLLDEAFSALDRELRIELAGDVRRLVDELAIPAILVTHHRMEARALADRLVLLAGGRVVQAGPLAALWPRVTVVDDADDVAAPLLRPVPRPTLADHPRHGSGVGALSALPTGRGAAPWDRG